MKTTIEIDQRLLRQAQKTLGTDTIKGTVEASLRTVIQHSQLQKLANALGTIPLDLTPGQLRSQRHKPSSPPAFSNGLPRCPGSRSTRSGGAARGT